MTSDGSFSMFPHAVATAVEYDIPACGCCSTTTRSGSSGTCSASTWTSARSARASASSRPASSGTRTSPRWRRRWARSRTRSTSPATSPALRGGARLRPARGARREGQPRHGRAADRHLAVPADRAGGANLRTSGWWSPDGAPYPFTAIVGQERLKQALLLNAVNPAVGGVLVRRAERDREVDGGAGARELLPEIEVVAGCPFGCDPAAPACADCRARAAAGERLPATPPPAARS